MYSFIGATVEFTGLVPLKSKPLSQIATQRTANGDLEEEKRVWP